MQDRALPPLPGQRPGSQQASQQQMNVDFFLPNGIMVSIPVNPKASLREIKDLLYREARKMPLFSLLKEQGFYNFLGQTSKFNH